MIELINGMPKAQFREGINDNFTESVASIATAQTVATNAATAAATAQSSANSAQSTANAANTAASTAQSTANTAQSTATTANTNASNAVTTANTANTNATNALAIANNALPSDQEIPVGLLPEQTGAEFLVSIDTALLDWLALNDFQQGGGGGTVDQTIIDGSTNAVSSNAVFDQFIQLRGGYNGSMQDLFELINSGDIPLAQSTVTFGTSTSSSNVINWTDVANASTQTLQVLISLTWTDLYTGTNNTYTHTGLTAATEYSYRVVSNPTVGYAQSVSNTVNKTTASETGLVDITEWIGTNVTIAGNDLSPTASANSFARVDKHIVAGTSGIFEGVSNGATLCLYNVYNDTNSNNQRPDNQMLHAIRRDSGNGKIICITSGSYFSDDITGRPSTTKIRLRGDGTNINYEYSVNGTYSDVVLLKTAPQVGNLFPKYFAFDLSHFLNDTKGENLV